MSRVQKKIVIALVILIILTIGSVFAWTKLIKPILYPPKLVFDSSVTEVEQTMIKDVFNKSGFELTADLQVSITEKTELAENDNSLVMSMKVPVTDFYDTRIGVSTADVKNGSVAVIEVDELDVSKKLLALDDNYYLDTFKSGAFFRFVNFTGNDSSKIIKGISDSFKALSRNETLSLIQTGVTALGRMMIYKLNSVGDANYFSEKIGEILADADYTHTSNEVSFVDDCRASTSMLFCSPPEMLEVLKSSGFDIIELTGNHNNDYGANYNAKTIETYHDLGWGTFGGGINSTEAAKPYEINAKNTKIAMFGYNVPCDAISGDGSAGANCYDYEKMVNDISDAKLNSKFVIVDFQHSECYSYPDGYVEFPECDAPITGQTELFRSAINAGADMVVGVQAHQPQTFELYNGKPIFYGLGNLYFDQDEWPGTERSIVLKHYFINGKHVQTKLLTTVYDEQLQTRFMNNDEQQVFIDRLLKSRP